MNAVKKAGCNLLNILAAVCILWTGSLLGDAAQSPVENVCLQYALHAAVQVGCVLLLGILYCRHVLDIDLTEVGLSGEGFRKVWIPVSFALPAAVLLFYRFCIPCRIVSGDGAYAADAIAYALFGVGIPAGICEEFIFRGIIFRYMKRTAGTASAVIIPAVVFASLHIMNMQAFDSADIIQLILGGASVAVMFTMIALLSGSIWPGALVHAVWNALIIGNIFGVGEIVNGKENISLIRIMPESRCRLLTGGSFGIEAALPAIAGYAAVAVFCGLAIRKRGPDSD